MTFRLQDEVASSNRAWVPFDDLSRIQKIYPELLSLIKKEMLAGWAVTDQNASKINDSQQFIDENPGRKVFLLFIMSILMLAVAFMGFYLSRNNFDSFMSIKDALTGIIYKDPHPVKAGRLYELDKLVQFEAYMDRYMKKILRSGNQKDWQPFLRALAFNRDGKIEGAKEGVLRGEGSLTAPKNCSVEAWKTRWQDSKRYWKDYLDGKILPKKDWAKILAWDPFWIKARIPSPGWFSGERARYPNQPGNYYEACIYMATKALNEITDIPEDLVRSKEIMQARLRFFRNVIRGEYGEEKLDGSLWTLSCIESSEEIDSLIDCTRQEKYGSEWETLLLSSRRWSEIRIYLKKQNMKKIDKIDYFKTLVQDIQPVGPVSKFDYASDIYLLNQIITFDGNIQMALERAKDAFPDMNYTPYLTND
ncbi:MAG: hypothetical protein HQK54_05825 [Oligoflexales bacterium]|nr:hypothetical protein [Oligoflexales bacterium]